MLAGLVGLRAFEPRQRNYKVGDPSERAFILVSVAAQVTTIDDDNQVVVPDLPGRGDVIEKAETLAERVADTVASFGGSWTFILLFGAVLVVDSMINVEPGHKAWDPQPFILLNLFLSMLAAIQAPVIMMNQNRQDKKDRLRSERDFDVNRRAHAEIQGLAQRMHLLHVRIEDVSELVRGARP